MSLLARIFKQKSEGQFTLVPTHIPPLKHNCYGFPGSSALFPYAWPKFIVPFNRLSMQAEYPNWKFDHMVGPQVGYMEKEIEEALFSQAQGGLAAWLPYQGPMGMRFQVGENFYGIDRTVDSIRLGGSFLNATDMPILDSFMDAICLCLREGGKPSAIYVSSKIYFEILKGLSCKATWTNGTILSIMGPHGKVDIIPTSNLPDFLSYVLDESTWAINYKGEDLINISSTESQSPQYKTVHLRSDFALICHNPAANCVILHYEPW